ncbi:hypothetical protein D3C71_1359220 [compost metagenome]
MPGPVSNGGVVAATSTEVHNMLHPGLFRLIEKHLALAQHVDGIAGRQKGAVNTLQRRRQRFFLIKIHNDGADALSGKRLGFFRGAYRRHQGNGGVCLQVTQSIAAYLAGGAGNQHPWFVYAHQ